MTTLQQLLWQRWGSAEHPAEWDGRDGAGGKCSQRFWEYLWVLNQIGSWPQSVLDVGGGATLFFHDLLSINIPVVMVVDPVLDDRYGIGYIPMSLEQCVERSVVLRQFDWITCISVLEHVEDKPAFCAALDTFDAPIAMTFELGDGCITMQEMYRCMASFTRHFVSKQELCPVFADNSGPGKWKPIGILLLPRLTSGWTPEEAMQPSSKIHV